MKSPIFSRGRRVAISADWIAGTQPLQAEYMSMPKARASPPEA